MKETLTIKEASEILGMNPQTVRIRIERGTLPIGHCLPPIQGERNTYIVSKALLNKYLGLDA